MKIRLGFVSNSSSSSFLCILKDKSILNKQWIVREHEYVYPNDYKYSYNDWVDGELVEYKNKEDFLLQTGYIYERDEELYSGESAKVYYQEFPMLNAADTGLSRCTAFAYGQSLLDFLKELKEKEDDYNIEFNTGFVSSVEQAIEKYGLENLIFLRESDEEMGGSLPEELKEVTNDFIFQMEWH